MILHFEITQTDNKPYISNPRALLRCDAGVGRDKNHLITTPKPEEPEKKTSSVEKLLFSKSNKKFNAVHT